MLTPFGLASRKLRLEKALRLLDVAKRMGCAPAFLSAVETGRKKIPTGFVDLMSRAMDLTPDEKQKLSRAADRTKSEVKVDVLGADQRELVAAFARNVSSMSPEMIATIKRHVFKSRVGEEPFVRRRLGLVVPAASNALIQEWAEKVRGAFVPDNEIEFPIMDVLEFRMEHFVPGFYVDVREVSTMNGDEGLVVAGKDCIALREDVYEGAWKGTPRDRFTACHEFAHFLMHREVSFARTRDSSSPVYQDSEWQADTFAGALLMSERHLTIFSDVDDAADQCGMSDHAAQVQWSKYRKRGLVR